MTKEHKSSNNKRPILRKVTILCLALAVLTGVFGVAALTYNNVSIISDAVFTSRVDTAIESAEKWVENHRIDILEKKNSSLLKMLSECDEVKANPLFDEIVGSFMATKVHPKCWKRLIDPNWPVNGPELNQTIAKESIDNKWVLYAIATDEAKIA